MHIHPDLLLFSILLISILWIAARIFYHRRKGNPLSSKWTRSIKYIGQISLALGILLTLLELTTALEHLIPSLTADQIAMGLQSILFSSMHGLIVYLVAM